jgi:hypothetical protein
MMGVSELELAELFADALVTEIKAEMGRQSLSSRALGRLINKSSQYMSDRLDGGNVKTGRRVVLNIWDLAAISGALGMSEVQLIERAQAAASGGNVIPGNFGVGAITEDRRAVAKKKSRDPGGDEGEF